MGRTSTAALAAAAGTGKHTCDVMMHIHLALPTHLLVDASWCYCLEMRSTCDSGNHVLMSAR